VLELEPRYERLDRGKSREPTRYLGAVWNKDFFLPAL
jgi:hypothetical protein